MNRTITKPAKLFSVIAAVMILAAAAGLMLHLNSKQDYGGKPESITVAYAPFEPTALIWIAEDRHFFNGNGLSINFRKYGAGVEALDGMINGEADIAAGVAEFPLVGSAFKKEKIRIFGSTDKAEFIYLIGRKDRGIGKVLDLKGKRVGTTIRTISHFYLGRFLNLHGMDVQDITLVDLKTPAEWVNAIADGAIDAVATAQPYINSAKDRLGANATIWPAQSSQPLHGLLIASNKWIINHPELIQRFLTALAQAEMYAFRNPAEAKAIVQRRLNLDTVYMETVWSQNQFSLSLDESLILAMESEARWMIMNNLAPEKQVPNFLDYIYEDALKAVKPGAVNIIR